MSIVDAIKKLREQLTGEPGKGASITDAIIDLTEGLTGTPGKGASISDVISNLADHAEDISGGGGGGGDIATITIVNNTNFNWTLKGAFAISQGGMTASYYEIDSNVFPIEGGDYGVFLYGGQAIVTLIPDAHHHVEWSGDAAPSGGGYLVTGDCTVTLTT